MNNFIRFTMMTRIVLALFMGMSSISVCAQVHPTVFVGGSYTKMANKFGSVNDNDHIVGGGGLMFGAGAEVSLAKKFLLVPNIQLSRSSFTSNNFVPSSIDFSIWWLRIPVFATYRLGLGKNIAIDFGIGPYMGLRMNDDDVEEVSSSDFGLSARVGGLFCNRFFINVERDMGAKNIGQSFPQVGAYRYYNTTTSISVGYRF